MSSFSLQRYYAFRFGFCLLVSLSFSTASCSVGAIKKNKNLNENFRKRDGMLGSYGTIIGSKRNGKVKTKQWQQQRNERITDKKMLIKINMYSAKSSCIGCHTDYLIFIEWISFYRYHFINLICSYVLCVRSFDVSP